MSKDADDMCPACGEIYNDDDYQTQICSKCGHDNESGETAEPDLTELLYKVMGK